MRVCFAFVLVVLVAHTAWAAPKRPPCQGPSCRRLPQRATKAGTPTPTRKTTTTGTTSTPKVTSPASASLTKGSSSSAGADPSAEGGWLTAPTTAAPKTKIPPKVKTDKPGVCGQPESYGINCIQFLNQCKYDEDCPDLSKCCMVGGCGNLCVSPKTKGDIEDKKLPVRAIALLSKNEVEEEEQYIFTSEEIEGDKDSFSTVKAEDTIVMDEKNSTSKNITNNSDSKATGQKNRGSADNSKSNRATKEAQQKLREGKSEENGEEEEDSEIKAEENAESQGGATEDATSTAEEKPGPSEAASDA